MLKRERESFCKSSKPHSFFLSIDKILMFELHSSPLRLSVIKLRPYKELLMVENAGNKQCCVASLFISIHLQGHPNSYCLVLKLHVLCSMMMSRFQAMQRNTIIYSYSLLFSRVCSCPSGEQCNPA